MIKNLLKNYNFLLGIGLLPLSYLELLSDGLSRWFGVLFFIACLLHLGIGFYVVRTQEK